MTHLNFASCNLHRLSLSDPEVHLPESQQSQVYFSARCRIAQPVEQLTVNQRVVGSSPTAAAISLSDRIGICPMLRSLHFFWVALTCLLALSASATTLLQPQTNSKRSIQSTPLKADFELTGDLSNTAWHTPPNATRFFDELRGSPVDDQTEVWLLTSEKYIYVGFKLYDKVPAGLVSIETSRDTHFNGNSTEDFIEVDLDPGLTYSGSGLFRFGVTPNGTPSAILGPGRGSAREWQGLWEAKAKKQPFGWTAEIRIPWKALNYSSSAKTFGINFKRFQARTRITSVWSQIEVQEYENLEGLWDNVNPPKREAAKVILLPYTLEKIGSGSTGFNNGLDARYQVKSDLTAVASLNPDFGTIENAVLGINFSRSERLLDERRPFFLEGANLFSSGDFSDLGSFFYSQRIADFDFGTKFYGKLNPADTIGLLNTETFGQRTDTVVHLNHQLSPFASYGIFFSQKDEVGDRGQSAWAQSSLRSGNLATTINLTQSRGTYGAGDGENAAISYHDKFLFWLFQADHVSPNLHFTDGYIPFQDFKGASLYTNYSGEFNKGYVRNMFVEQQTQWNYTNANLPFQHGITVDGAIDNRQDYEVQFAYIRQSFLQQQDNYFSLELLRGASNRLNQIGVGVSDGIIADQKYTYLLGLAQQKYFRHLTLAYNGGIQSLGTVDQLHVLTVNWDFSPTRSIGGRLVVRNGQTNWYLSYRRSGERGISTYILIGDPNATTFQRVLQIKVVVPFSI